MTEKLNPKVSILIPLYNSEKYIADTIESALVQTWKNKEIIIVDDGSSDNSYEVAKSYGSNNIKIFKQNNNGACYARNEAFKKSTGDYIQYLDADDLLAPNKLEEQLLLLKKLNYDKKTIATCNFLRLVNHELSIARDNLDKVNKGYNKPRDLLRDLWLYYIPSYVPTVYLTPRYLISASGGWDKYLLKNQDGEFFSRILNIANHVVFSKETFTVWRYVPTSISTTHSTAKADSMFKSYVSISSILLTDNQEKLTNESIGIAFGNLVYNDGNRTIYLKTKRLFRNFKFPIIYPDNRTSFRFFCFFMDCFQARKLSDKIWRLRQLLIRARNFFQ